MSNDRPQPDGSIQMEATELLMRWQSGGRFRLRAMPYMKWPTEPPKVGGQWPLITLVDDSFGGPVQIYVITEALPHEAYEAYPKDTLLVIPVHPAHAGRSTRSNREAVPA